MHLPTFPRTHGRRPARADRLRRLRPPAGLSRGRHLRNDQRLGGRQPPVRDAAGPHAQLPVHRAAERPVCGRGTGCSGARARRCITTARPCRAARSRTRRRCSPKLGGTVLIWPDKIWFRPANGTFGRAEPKLDRRCDARQQRRHRRRRARERAAGGRRGHALSRGRRRDAQRLQRRAQQRHVHPARHRRREADLRPGHVRARGHAQRRDDHAAAADAQHACSYGNRLWACAHDTVWCTKLGDPLSWFWYEADENGAVATAAWSVDVGAPGDFFRLRGDRQRRGVPQAGGALAALRHAAGQLPARGLGRARRGAGLWPHARDGGGDALLPLPVGPARTAGGRLDAHWRRARAHALGRGGGHGRHALVSLGAGREKAPGTCSHTTRAAACGAARTIFTRAPLPGAAALYAQDARGVWRFGTGSTAQMQSMLETGDFVSGSPDCKRLLRDAAAAGGGGGRKHHGGGAV